MTLVSTLECGINEVYIKFIKKTFEKANEESFKLFSGSQVVFTSPSLSDNYERSIEICIPKSVNNQYTLEMYDTSSFWSDGAWLMAESGNGKCIWKGMMTTRHTQTQPLSLYSPINRNSLWKYTSSASGNWKMFDFIDTDWINVVLGSTTEEVTGTQYFRNVYLGISGMAAIDLQLYYRFGIVAYINGVEVYRDNMPDGEPTSNTLGTGNYTSYDYHGIIRPAYVGENSSSVLAVEVHFSQLVYKEIIQFNSFLAFYAGVDESNPCYIVPGFTGSSSDFTNAEDVFSWTYASSAQFHEVMGYINIELFNNSVPVVNSLRIWPYTNEATQVMVFTISALSPRSGEEELLVVNGVTYKPNEWRQWDLVSTAIPTTKFSFFAINSGRILMDIIEFQLLVCNRHYPSSIEYPSSYYEFYTHYQQVEISPVMYGFTNCEIKPDLPSGLSFGGRDCTISGVAKDAGTQTFTVTSRMESHNTTGTLTLQFTECSGTLGLSELTN